MAAGVVCLERKAADRSQVWLRRVVLGLFSFLIGLLVCTVPWRGLAMGQTFANPHGGFSNYTQFCLVCHATHEAPGIKLIKEAPESAVCFTCHNGTGSNYNIEPEMNLNPATNALHPIAVNLANNTGVYSYTANTTAGIAPPGPYNCSQCHNPHGDVGNGRLLRQPYNASEYVTYTSSPDPYALCWTCHNTNAITTDQSFFPLHKFHIINQRASCSACHFSPHGVANTEMVRFNPAYVSASLSLGTGPTFTDAGGSHGNCTLTCHGKDHTDFGY